MASFERRPPYDGSVRRTKASAASIQRASALGITKIVADQAGDLGCTFGRGGGEPSPLRSAGGKAGGFGDAHLDSLPQTSGFITLVRNVPRSGDDEVNGAWTLRVTDREAGGEGAILE